MIRNRADLQRYREADRIQLRRSGTRPTFYDEVWRFQRLLRRVEYFLNCRRDLFGRLQHKYWSWRYHRQGMRCGFEIPPNIFGPGLSIAHKGTIIIHPDVRVGNNCRLHVDVTIGTRPGPPPEEVPTIGDDCYIGPGARLYGPIAIGPGTVVGANAVVNRSFPEGRMTVAGVPARKVSDTPSDEFLIATRSVPSR